MITLITALYDINRFSIDGRKFDNYKLWLIKTLKINQPMVIFIDKENESLVKNIRDNLPTKIIIQQISDIPYYKYYNDIYNIINSESYKKKIKDSNRIECNSTLYNVIIYSKFEWLRQSSINNWFNTKYFLWIDAGLSRFFDNENLNTWPGNNTMNLLSDNKFIVQARYDIFKYHIDNNFIWDSCNLLSAGLFGGTDTIINNISDMVKETFEMMIDNNCVNNEQITMALIWKRYPTLFNIIINNTGLDFPLFKFMSN